MIPEGLLSMSGDRFAGTNPASPSTRSHRPDSSDAGLQGFLQRSLYVHDRQQSQERALLRQVHRLLPDADDRQSGEFIVSLCTFLGALQRNFFSKNPRLLWKWMSGSRSNADFFWKIIPK